MHILILNAVKGWSGIGSHSIELALALRERGHNVILCSTEVNIKHAAEKFDLPIREIKLKNLADIRAVLKIIKVVLKEDIKVIITNLGKEYWPATFVAKLLRLKIIVVRHQTNRLKRITCWLLARHVDRVVAVSNAVTGALIAGGIPVEKIDVIHNAINLERFNPFAIDRDEVRRELGLGNNDIVVGTAGRLYPEKGGLELLYAIHGLIREYPSLKLMFVGEGPYRVTLEREAQRLSINDSVIFTGLRKDMERMYAAMDIFVLPSTCKEAFGMVLIEAMAMIKPVIATSVGGILEIITRETDGILIPAGDHAAIANAIARVINDNALSKRIALEGRRTVQYKFSEKAMGDGFEKVLREIFNPSLRGDNCL